ncbi:MAG TPA: MAPEG family protein [Ramlibacter sp.]|nr:MAPEG family protein [Ramlibacter sp.]
MTTYPAWPAFVAALLALFAKTSATSLLQVASRLRARTFLLPEDARMLGVNPVAEEADLVRRFAGVWRNDVENLPLFLALALTYVLAGAPLFGASVLFGAYVTLRYLHTGAYLAGLQPGRALCYLASLAVCWTIALKALLLVLEA